MGAAEARLAVPTIVRPRGSPLTLGALCLIAAGLGAAVGAMFGVQAEQRADAAADAVGEAARQAAEERLHQKLRASKVQLQATEEKLVALDKRGALGAVKDLEEAHRIGLARALDADLERLTEDDARRVLAALVHEGRRNDLDPLLLAAVIRVETHFDPYAVSYVGARGLMQLMPATAEEVARRHGFRVTAKQLFNPVVNIELGAAYLKELIDRFGDVRTALIAYNAGPGLARNRRLSSGVRAYPRNVLSNYERLAWHARGADGAVASSN